MTSYSRSLIPSRYPLRRPPGSRIAGGRRAARRASTPDRPAGQGAGGPADGAGGLEREPVLDPDTGVRPRGVPMEHVPPPEHRPHRRYEDDPDLRAAPRESSDRRRPAVQAGDRSDARASPCRSAVLAAPASATAALAPRRGRHRQRPRSRRSRTSPTWTSCSTRRRRRRRCPGTRPTGSPRSRRSSCRGPTRMRGPGGTFQRVGGGALDAATGYWGQGAYNADDIARAAVVYLRHWTLTGAEASRDNAYELLRSHRLPADDRRTERGQRRAVDAARRHAQPVRRAGGAARPVRLRTELLARPHDLGARRGLRGLPGRRPGVRGLPRGATGAVGRRPGPAGAGEATASGPSRTACACPRG